MQEQKKANRILAIECAVENGSLALIEGGFVLASTSSEVGLAPSRAEELIPAVDLILRKGNLSLKEIDLIAVSTGPGSYSGIRIGIATAIGLKHSLNVNCIGVPLLEAMALAIGSSDEIMSAVPVGKHDIAFQSFRRNAGDNLESASIPSAASEQDFLSELRSFGRSKLTAPPSLLERLRARTADEVELVDAGPALAETIGLAAVMSHFDSSSLEPLYVRNQVARPTGF